MSLKTFLILWSGLFEVIDDETGDPLCESPESPIFKHLMGCPVQDAKLIYDPETDDHRMLIRVIIPI